MRPISCKIDGLVMDRVDKRSARKLHDMHVPYAICACNLNPESPWGVASKIDDFSYDFDLLVDMFAWYNCNSETGRYPSYFVARDFAPLLELDDRERAAYENACDCLHYGYGSSSWNDCGISPDRRETIWHTAYRRLEDGYRY